MTAVHRRKSAPANGDYLAYTATYTEKASKGIGGSTEAVAVIFVKDQ